MDINNILSELAQYTRLQEEAADMVEALKDKVKEYMIAQGVDTLTGAEHKATYKAVTSSRIDTAALKRDKPEIATAFLLIAANDGHSNKAAEGVPPEGERRHRLQSGGG